MTTYRVQVSRGDDWLIARHDAEPRFTTQGKDLDELVYMVRDAIESLTATDRFEIDLVIPASLRLRQPA